MKYYFVFSLLFAITCCTRKEKNTENKKQLQWLAFSLLLEDTNIIRGNIMSDSIEIQRRNNQTEFYFIGKSNRDSLFSWANELAEYKQPEKYNFCTDYVGKLGIKIKYSDILTKHVYFTSICDWRKINNETRKIDSLLISVIKL